VAGGDFSPPEWGQELDYPEWIKLFLPALHEGITRTLLTLWWLRARGRRKSPTGDRA
jgi:hypothetical protein